MAAEEMTNMRIDGQARARYSIHLDRAVILASVSIPVLLVSLTLLAVVGVFTPLAAGLVGLLPALVVGVLVARRHIQPVLKIPALGPTIVLGIVLVVVTVLNVVYVGEHMLTNRDPGVYLTVARWLSSNGNLLVEGTTGPFEGLGSITANWNGYYESRSDGLLYAQFLHSYPSLMASLRWVFGDGALFYSNTAIFLGAMTATYLLVAQFVRSWVATLSVSVSAVSVVAFYFVRSTYSEPLMYFALVLGLLAFYVGIKSQAWMVLCAAGLAIGTTALVRIDGWMLIGPYLIAGVLGMMVWNRVNGRRTWMVLFVLLSPFVAGIVGLLDGVLRSPEYLIDRISLVAPMLAFVGICMMIAVGLTIIAATQRSATSRAQNWLIDHQRGLRRGVAWAVVAGAAFFLFVRPIFFVARGGKNSQIDEFLVREGQAADVGRTLGELSLRWFTWYWGWIGLALVIAGLLIVLLHRSQIFDGVWFVLLVVVPQAAVYILQPKIVPDQPWAMRRFYASALVLIPLLMAISFEWIIRRAKESEGRQRSFARYGFAIGAVFALIYPISVAFPLLTLGPQAGLRASTNELCSVLPPDAAVIVTDVPIDTEFGAAIRTFCETPTVAAVPGITSDQTNVLVRDLEVRGFTPVLVSVTDLGLEGWEVLGADTTEFPLAEAVFLRPPVGAHYFEFSWVAVAPVRPESRIGE